MKEFLDQASHNLEFHENLEANFDDKFFDWKITVLFYVSIHYLKALASKRKIEIGDTHGEIANSVNPDRSSPIMAISRNAWREYRALYQYSRTARYSGISNPQTFEKLMQADHHYCLEHLRRFKMYVAGQGVR